MATRPRIPPDAGPEVFAAGATQSAAPGMFARASGRAAPPPPKRRMRRFVWVFMAVLGVLLVATVLAWQWLGRDDSLAYALQRAARALPEGQQLSSEGVRGSLTQGGHIDRLRWQSDGLTVEAEGIDIGWSLTPLLARTLRLGKLQAERVVLTPSPSTDSKAPVPLESLALPLNVDIPFAVLELVWAAATPVQADSLSGRYRYSGGAHQLELAGADLPQGHVSAKARLQGAAPMALEAQAEAQLNTALADGERTVGAHVQAQAAGTLAGIGARIDLTAALHAQAPASTTAPAAGTPGATPEMQANASASIAPWAEQPVLRAKADLQAVDLAALWAQAPATLLHGHLAADPAPGGWHIEAQLANAHPAPWDQGGLPVSALNAQADWDGTRWRLADARLQAGDGALALQGSFAPESQALELTAQLQRLDPARLHTSLAAAPLGGQASLRGTLQDLQFDLQLAAIAGRPAGVGTDKTGRLRIDHVSARGQWRDGVLRLPQADIEALQARLKASDLSIATHPALAISGTLQASLPGTSARAEGQLAARSGAGSVRLEVAAAEQTLAWLRKVPGLQALAPGLAVRGSAALAAQWKGGWHNALAESEPGTKPLQLQARLDAPRLQVTLPEANGVAPAPLELLSVQLRADGSVARAELSVEGQVRQGQQSATLKSAGIARLLAPDPKDKGGLAAGLQLQALNLRLQDAAHPGQWAVQTGPAFGIELRRSAEGALAIKADSGSATLTAPLPGKVALRWEPLAFTRTATGAVTLKSSGAIADIPLAWADLASSQEPALLQTLGLRTDLVFGGQWSVDAAETLSASVRLQRSSGDLRIATEGALPATHMQSKGDGAPATATPPSRADTTAAGVRRIDLQLDAQGEELRAAFTWDSQQAGEVSAQATTRLQRQGGGWVWPADAPLTGTVQAQLPQVGVWSALAPPGWRISGTLQANAKLSGNRSSPQWQGQLGADKINISSLLDDVDLQDGRLRAQLAGNRIDITELSLQGGRGSSARIAGLGGNRTPPPTDGGILEGSGSVQWGSGDGAPQDLRMDFKARARQFQVLARPDRQAGVSGTLEATLRERQFKLRGDLRIDRASILLPDANAPSLGADVVVRSKARDEAAKKTAQQAAKATQRAQAALPPDVAITLDLGDDFAFQGLGLTTRLEGKLDIRSGPVANAPPRVLGEVRTVAGRYRAWGQVLDVETGLVRFSGPYNNPSLDILALRPYIEVRAGVQVTGTALDPRVRLYSEPDLPDAEKLSWVVLGRSAAAGGAEAAVLQQAALALLGGQGGGAGAKLANSLGLDEIGFKGPGNGEDANGAALTFGKRISKDLYLTYERSLAGTLGTLYIFYDLSQRLRLRAQTGTATGLDLIYTVRYGYE